MKAIHLAWYVEFCSLPVLITDTAWQQYLGMVGPIFRPRPGHAARRFQGGVDQFGAGFGLVHGVVRAYSAA